MSTDDVMPIYLPFTSAFAGPLEPIPAKLASDLAYLNSDQIRRASDLKRSMFRRNPGNKVAQFIGRDRAATPSTVDLTNDLYDRYFCVFRARGNAVELLGEALLRCINAVISEVELGHDMTVEQEEDLIRGIKIVAERVSN